MTWPKLEFTIDANGNPVGLALPPDFRAPPFPEKKVHMGRYCRLEPIDFQRHAPQLVEAYKTDTKGVMWTYLSYGPFDTAEEYIAFLERMFSGSDPSLYAIVDLQTEKALGVLSYLRIFPAQATIEIGHVSFSPLMQRTRISTEAYFLLMDYAFGLGYRRVEWKCDSLNKPSRDAAMRLGMSFDGVFRHDMFYKGRNRNTAWFGAIAEDWPEMRTAFTTWLDPANFDASGRQRQSLSALTSRREILCPRWFEMRVAFTTWRDPANFDGSGRQKQSLSALASRFLATRGPYEKEACFKSFGNVELLHP